MYDINHWIPAFACLQQAGRNDNGGDRLIMSDTNRTMARITDTFLF